jgi:coenzyme F420-reducing hydrogenase delta subunit/Pyruvate/2-oxoacid:ferredoxin oxidoreductase delta subunit
MIPQEEFRKIPRVLVWGNGLSASETAGQLVFFGYDVFRVNPEDQTQLTRIEGFAGDFQVTLSQGIPFSGTVDPGKQAGVSEKQWMENVGAIVFSPELISEGNFPVYSLAPSSQVVALEELAGMTAQERGERDRRRLESLQPDSYVAFLIGLKDEGNAADMSRTLSLALEIRQNYQSQVYIFCRNVKVAEPGLERLYQTCRDEGVIFFKFDQTGPEIIRSNDRVVLQFMDVILDQPFELTPDLLVVDSAHTLAQEIRELMLSAQIGLDESGFLQPANVHLLPQASLRAGIFIAGPGKGPMLPRTCLEEARATALQVHHFFNGEPSEHLKREVTVDKGLCTICLTCLRFCPHQAIGWTHRIFIHPLACQRCGICASECPMDAIQIAGFSDQEVEAKLTVLLQKWQGTESRQPRVVIFGCQRSAGVAWQEAQGSRYKVQGDVKFISLPCAGKIDPDFVLKALAMGAGGVLVLACPEENCKSLHGNTYARGRIGEVQEYVEEAGFNPARIRFEPLSSNMVWRLIEIIEQFLGELKEEPESDRK